MNVAIIDDDLHILESISRILINHKTIALSFKGTNVEAFLSFIEKNEPPEVLLLDINMPHINGIEGVLLIKAKAPDIKILMLTAFDNDDYIFQSIMNGSSGYLLKEDIDNQLEEALDMIVTGGAPMSPTIAFKTLNLLRQKNSGALSSTTSSFSLTKREIEILQVLSEGMDYNQIAEELYISPKTVRNHIQNIYEKMQVHNKAEAIRLGIQNQIIK